MAQNEFSRMSPEKRIECAKRGGIRSGEVRRAKREMREMFKSMMDMPLHKGKVASIESIKSFADLKGKNITTQEALGIAMIQQALKGNVKAMSLIHQIMNTEDFDRSSNFLEHERKFILEEKKAKIKLLKTQVKKLQESENSELSKLDELIKSISEVAKDDFD